MTKKLESSYLPFVAQSGYGRYIFRPLIVVCICYSAEQIVKLGMSSRTHGKWAEQNGRGKRAQISRLPEGFPVRVFCIFYGHSKGSSNV